MECTGNAARKVRVSRRTVLRTTGFAALGIPAILRAQAGASSTERKELKMEIKRSSCAQGYGGQGFRNEY